MREFMMNAHFQCSRILPWVLILALQTSSLSSMEEKDQLCHRDRQLPPHLPRDVCLRLLVIKP